MPELTLHCLRVTAGPHGGELSRWPELLDHYLAYRIAQAEQCGRTYHPVRPHPEDFDGVCGTYIVAEHAGEGIGCVGVRFLDEHTTELKNMWVESRARRWGVATGLVTAAEDWARDHGATRMRLDTHETLRDAVRLYERSGYQRIPAYNTNPNASLWFEKQLGASPTR